MITTNMSPSRGRRGLNPFVVRKITGVSVGIIDRTNNHVGTRLTKNYYKGENGMTVRNAHFVNIEDVIEDAASRLSSIRKTFRGDAMKMTPRESYGTALLIDDVITLLDQAKQECLAGRTVDIIPHEAKGG
jgi:hypothetical protein